MSWTERLRKNPAARLFGIQERTLAAAEQCRGVICGARVGAGKTLLAATLPVVLGAKRTLLVVSGKGDIPEKTRKEMAAYRKDWRLVEVYKQVTYELMSTKEGDKILAEWQPDLIIADECQNWRRVQQNAGARKVARYMAEHPETMYCGLTGSLMKFGLADYAHHFAWAFGQSSPLPTDPESIASLAKRVVEDSTLAAQVADHMRAHPGVIISDDVFDGVGLTIEPLFLNSGLEDVLAAVRRDLVKPDGGPLVLQTGDKDDDKPAGHSVAAVCRQIALGFYYVPDRTPPASYVRARRDWFGSVNARISSGYYDTEGQIKQAIRSGCVRGREKLEAWEKARDEFKFESVPVWLSDDILKQLAEWSQDGGIIWTKHTAVGERLSNVFSIPYYGAGGKTSGGKSILRSKDFALAASANALSVGHNLQRWNRACITNCPSNSADIEQTIGRQFREKQTRDVHVDILISCEEHYRAFDEAQRLAKLEEVQLRKRTILGSVAKGR